MADNLDVPELTLDDLVANRTMSPAMARTLGTAVAQRDSFLVFALPRLAGKSTVLQAMLAHRGPWVDTRIVSGDDERELAELRRATARCYLVFPEISDHGWDMGYRWGEPVRRIFALQSLGHAVAGTLHADGVEEAFAQLAQRDGVPDEDAAFVRMAVHLRSFGDWRRPVARRVVAIHRIERVVSGVPITRVLHAWDERRDAFDD